MLNNEAADIAMAPQLGSFQVVGLSTPKNLCFKNLSLVFRFYSWKTKVKFSRQNSVFLAIRLSSQTKWYLKQSEFYIFFIHLRDFVLFRKIFEKTFPNFSSFQNRQNILNQYFRSCSSTFFRGLVSHASIFCFPRNIKMPKFWKCTYWNTSFLYTCMSKCVTGLDFAGCSNPLFSKTTWFIFFRRGLTRQTFDWWAFHTQTSSKTTR